MPNRLRRPRPARRGTGSAAAGSSRGRCHGVGRNQTVGQSAAMMSGDYAGPATISDGVVTSIHDVEIHTTPRENVKFAAWHVNIAGTMPHELRTPQEKALSVLLPDGRRGVGTLVDPHLHQRCRRTTLSLSRWRRDNAAWGTRLVLAPLPDQDFWFSCRSLNMTSRQGGMPTTRASRWGAELGRRRRTSCSVRTGVSV